MLSSRINPSGAGGEDDDEDEEGETSMPGDYDSWPGRAPRIPPPRPIVPPARRRPPPPPPLPSPPSKPRAAGRPATPRVKIHHSRRRPLTPEIVIDRHHHHRSSRGHRIMTIPMDYRPTLGLRGPPRQVLEIERVRCRPRRHRHRHRKHRSLCYKYDDAGYNPPPQPNIMFANSLPATSYPAVQQQMMAPANQSSSLMTYISNLTPEMIENLPRRTVHLPPIHLPGSQADANTELETVVFPAEIINPADGTLSIIQSKSAINNNRTGNIPHSAVAVPPPPPVALGMTSGPFMRQVENLFQRMNLSQAQPSAPLVYSTSFSPTSPPTFQPPQSPNSYYNPQNFPIINVANTDPYPPANIQTVIQRPNQPYNSTITAPINPVIGIPYQPTNITPYQSTNPASYNSHLTTAPPYNPANITPYRQNTTAPATYSDVGPYRPANITPYSAMPTRSGGDSSRSLPNNPSQSQTPYQANVSMPKPILRNRLLNSPVNTTYTRLNSSIVSSQNGGVREMETVV